jgi:hypothetical protein
MQSKDTAQQARGGLLRRVWTTLSDPGVERYAPFVEQRTYGRATTNGPSRRAREEDAEDRPHHPMPWQGPMPGSLLPH